MLKTITDFLKATVIFVLDELGVLIVPTSLCVGTRWRQVKENTQTIKFSFIMQLMTPEAVNQYMQ